MVGCMNKNDKVKKILRGTEDESYITWFHDLNVIEFDIDKKIEYKCDDRDCDMAITKLNPIAEKHGCTFYKVHNNIILYKRVHPAYCDICKRVHDSDNSFIGFVNSNEDYNFISYNCRRAIIDGQENIFLHRYNHLTLYDLIKTTPPLSESQNLNMIPCNKYCGDLMPYELVPILFVKANMGVGKTKSLVEYINKHFTNGYTESKIIIISFRKTFSSSMKGKFPDFTLYSDKQGQLNDKKVIVQLESLFRLSQNMREPADLIVLDESESIFEQFNSGLFKHFNVCIKVFINLIKNARHVVLMDANMSDRSYNSIRAITSNESYLHWNLKNISAENRYYLTDKIGLWMVALLEELEDDKKIVIPVLSLKMSKVLKSIIETKYPDKKVLLYNSETDVNTKKQHFKDVNKVWMVDVIIYTPTVSAGISFEEKNFDMVFAFFNSGACNAESAMQMLSRVRDLSLKKYMIYIDSSTNTMPDNKIGIEKSIKYNIELLSDVDFDYDENGYVVINKTPYYTIWLENTITKNKSLNNIAKRVIGLIKNISGEIFYYSKKMAVEDYGILEQDLHYCCIEMEALIEDVKIDINYLKAMNISNAKKLSEEEYEAIKQRIINEENVTTDEYNSYDLYKLKKYYVIDEGQTDINPDFVLLYNERKTKRIYKLLSELYISDSHEGSLNIIKKTQQLYLESSMAKLDNHIINVDFTYPIHKLLYNICQLFSFDIYGLEGTYNSNTIDKVIVNNFDTIVIELKKMYELFKLKHTDINYHKDKISITRRTIFGRINKILNIAYDKCIQKNTKDSYAVVNGDLFSNKENKIRPNI